MNNYQERLAEAQAYRAHGLRRVQSEPQPNGQKFNCGVWVMIADDLGPTMVHYTNGVPAKVEYVYEHAYPGESSDGIKSYSLLVRTPVAPYFYSSCSWYYEHQLTLIEDQALINKLNAEIDEMGL